MFAFKLMDPQGTPQNYAYLLDLDRLTEKIIGPLSDRSEGVLLLALAGNDNHLCEGVLLQKRSQGEETLLDSTRGGRKPQVERHQRRPLALEYLNCFLPVAGKQNLELLGKSPFHRQLNALVIIDNKELVFILLPAPGLKSVPCNQKTIPGSKPLQEGILQDYRGLVKKNRSRPSIPQGERG